MIDCVFFLTRRDSSRSWCVLVAVFAFLGGSEGAPLGNMCGTCSMSEGTVRGKTSRSSSGSLFRTRFYLAGVEAVLVFYENRNWRVRSHRFCNSVVEKVGVHFGGT